MIKWRKTLVNNTFEIPVFLFYFMRFPLIYTGSSRVTTRRPLILPALREKKLQKSARKGERRTNEPLLKHLLRAIKEDCKSESSPCKTVLPFIEQPKS